MDNFFRDLRYARRSLFKSPGFTAITVLTLALGVGATTAVFSVVNGVLLRPLPYPDPDGIVQVWQINDQGNEIWFSGPNLEDVRERSRSFAALAHYQSVTASVAGGAEPVRASAANVSRDFLAVLGVQPLVGRGFVPEEQQEAGSPAVLVSHDYWETQLGGTTDLAGRTLTFSNRTYAVVGVMPPEFDFPAGTQLWTPAELAPRPGTRTAHNWRVVGRLADGVGAEQASREVSSIARQLKAEYGEDTWMEDGVVVPLHEELVGNVRPALLILLGAAGFLLLISCANAANLLLARAASRQKELAVRLALGASRTRVVQQIVTESLLLSLAGGVLGALLAFWGVRMLVAFEPRGLPRLDEIAVNGPVLAFALGLALLTAVGLGTATALRHTGRDAQDSLAQNQRSQGAGGGGAGMRGALVSSQVALTLVLLLGAGLLGRSLLQLLAVDPGFRTEGAVVMDLSLPYPQAPEDYARLQRFYDELLPRLRAIPGVEQVGAIDGVPIMGGGGNGTFLEVNGTETITGFEQFAELMKDETRTGEADYRRASADYFRAMEIPLLRGRLFDPDRDLPDGTHVALISESVARSKWPDQDPIGKMVQFGNMDGDLRPFTVVGVVGDIRERGLDTELRPTFYGYSRQRITPTDVVMAGSADEAQIIAAAGRVLRELNPETPVQFRTMEDVLSTSLSQRHFILLLLGVFGGAALLLAVLGIYGVVSYAVSQRTQEIGIRIAVGARAADVLRLVVRHGLTLTLVGIGIGLVVALVATRLLASMLYGVSTTDVTTFVLVPLVLGTTAALASYLPARRAARVDPMVALRKD